MNTFQTPKLITILLLGSALLGSCKKAATDPPVTATPANLLTAVKWQVEKVTERHNGAPEQTVYLRGAAGNQVDFSLVRQQFKPDGTLAYTDETGQSGNNAYWELLNNNTRLKITFGGDGITFEQVNITAGKFSYKGPFATADDYVCYTFIPAP